MKKNLNDIYQGLANLGLPVTYYEWEPDNVPDLPYIVYYETERKPFYADNKTYHLGKTIVVELYSEFKDEDLESLLEAFFYANDITLSNSDNYFWTDEQLHEVSYEFEI